MRMLTVPMTQTTSWQLLNVMLSVLASAGSAGVDEQNRVHDQHARQDHRQIVAPRPSWRIA